MTPDLRALLEKAAVAAEEAREAHTIGDARSAAAECLEILEKVLAAETQQEGVA